MGCSSGHLPFHPPPPPAPTPSDQEGALQDGGPRAPEALSTVERLAQATGGTEKSWYRCVFPFGLISLVIGVAGTGVTFSFNTMPQTKVVSVVLLGLGLAMVLLAVACWRIHRVKRRKRKEGGSFSSEQCAL
ncbi:transmembrane protein 100-like [Conger conger]|uniref:transmembrane protein 100-like n=1 Tax=Conger conger TaxID=82655 RepID=UPI002A5AC920|nr:transmembrane protein 100-like [Conger conger]